MNDKGLVLSNAANQTKGKHIHNYSSFDESLSYRKSHTCRFGDLIPSFEMEGIPTDSISLNTHDAVDSLSLKAPFKGSIRKIKESFMVPNMAILPFNWDMIYAQPSNGDDVPAAANCRILNFPDKAKNLFVACLYFVRNECIRLASLSSISYNECHDFYTGMMRTLIRGEYFFSTGSLLNQMGYKLSRDFHHFYFGRSSQTYDGFFDTLVNILFKNIAKFDFSWYEGGTLRSLSFRGLASEGESYASYSSLRAFLEIMRENPTGYITGLVVDSTYADVPTYVSYVTNYFLDDGTGHSPFDSPWFNRPASHPVSADFTDVSPSTCDLSRILAYQLVCAHFYSNSSIDWLYSAELYRSYIHELFLGFRSTLVSDFNFVRNGHSKAFDYLSGAVLDNLLFYRDTSLIVDPIGFQINSLTYSVLVNTSIDWFSYNSAALAAIFGYRKSLRFCDYFVGARPRPLAPINTDVAVSTGNTVSVVDVTRNIQAQRFANAVMRSRQKIEEYVQDLFGGDKPAPDYHNPFFLSREVEAIYGDEVQNTGDAQVLSANSRTSLFGSQNGRYTFTFRNDDKHPCIYLQIISFDAKRSYTRSMDRQFFISDRYDMFNPDFQYIGDQPVYGAELGYASRTDIIPDVFGYQGRDEQFKQRFDVACGGFIENLPGWLLTDVDRSRFYDPTLNPDFIRSYNTELDQFFLSLTGFSLGNYFHFILVTDNKVDAKRPIAVDPQILA